LWEQLDYNLLFRWFVGLSIDEGVWNHSTYTKNRERLIEANVARKLLRRIVRRAKAERLLFNEHFSVDGTVIESWASLKSMRRRDGKETARSGAPSDGVRLDSLPILGTVLAHLLPQIGTYLHPAAHVSHRVNWC
jgi:hypothetical protein